MKIKARLEEDRPITQTADTRSSMYRKVKRKTFHLPALPPSLPPSPADLVK